MKCAGCCEPAFIANLAGTGNLLVFLSALSPTSAEPITNAAGCDATSANAAITTHRLSIRVAAWGGLADTLSKVFAMESGARLDGV